MLHTCACIYIVNDINRLKPNVELCVRLTPFGVFFFELKTKSKGDDLKNFNRYSNKKDQLNIYYL